MLATRVDLQQSRQCSGLLEGTFKSRRNWSTAARSAASCSVRHDHRRHREEAGRGWGHPSVAGLIDVGA